MPYKDPAKAREAHRLAERKRRLLYGEHVNAIRKRSREKHQEKELASKRERYVRNRESALVYAAQYRAKHPEKVANCLRRSREKHKDRVRVEWARKRAKRHGAPGGHTRRERGDLFASYHSLCVYCHAPATTIDHIVPLAGGGSNGVENLVPSCRSCNSSKSDVPFVVWMAKHQRKAA